MKTTKLIACLGLVLGGTLLALPTTATAGSHTVEWTRQLGTSSDDSSRGVSADGLGNVYISGNTAGSLGGTNAGDLDAFVVKIKDLPGDFDGNGQVDGADFLKWQRGLGTIYDATDLADWEANYGMVAPLSATSTAVPEPATGIMLMLGITAMLFRRECVCALLGHAFKP